MPATAGPNCPILDADNPPMEKWRGCTGSSTARPDRRLPRFGLAIRFSTDLLFRPARSATARWPEPIASTGQRNGDEDMRRSCAPVIAAPMPQAARAGPAIEVALIQRRPTACCLLPASWSATVGESIQVDQATLGQADVRQKERRAGLALMGHKPNRKSIRRRAPPCTDAANFV